LKVKRVIIIVRAWAELFMSTLALLEPPSSAAITQVNQRCTLRAALGVLVKRLLDFEQARLS
jgi:hypothetical protein